MPNLQVQGCFSILAKNKTDALRVCVEQRKLVFYCIYQKL